MHRSAACFRAGPFLLQRLRLVAAEDLPRTRKVLGGIISPLRDLRPAASRSEAHRKDPGPGPLPAQNFLGLIFYWLYLCTIGESILRLMGLASLRRGRRSASAPRTVHSAGHSLCPRVLSW